MTFKHSSNVWEILPFPSLFIILCLLILDQAFLEVCFTGVFSLSNLFSTSSSYAFPSCLLDYLVPKYLFHLLSLRLLPSAKYI